MRRVFATDHALDQYRKRIDPTGTKQDLIRIALLNWVNSPKIYFKLRCPDSMCLVIKNIGNEDYIIMTAYFPYHHKPPKEFVERI